MAEIKPIKNNLEFGILTKAQVAEIRAATLTILEEVGIHFPSEKALKIFSDHGANIDADTQIVRIPADLVIEAMSHAPRSYALSGRTAGTELLLDGSLSYFSTDGSGTETIDLANGIQRQSTKADVAMMAKVSDYLSSISFYWPIVSAQDCGPSSPLHELEASFKNTSKHIQSVTIIGEELSQYALLMGEIIAGSADKLRKYPPLSSLVCTIAPLGQDKDGIEGAMLYARAGVPVGFMAMPNLGSTAPATMAGALAVGNSEVVSAMVLMQLVNPGAPVFHSILGSVMDPRSGSYITGISEKYLCNAAAVQIAHDWNVPSLAGAFSVDCPTPDSWQLGRDSVYTSLFTPLLGAELVEGLGLLKAATLLAPEQILYDDEIYHTHRKLAEGIRTNPDQIALDVIKSVGPGGHYLGQKHTRSKIRDIWLPTLTHPAPVLNDNPPLEIRERARERFRKILLEHEPEPLSLEIQLELSKILNIAEKG
ncbi:MAG: trimethylamine methyltransferase family protein [Anaerolineales bacterium]